MLVLVVWLDSGRNMPGPAPGTWAVLINLLTTTASAESAANYRNTPQHLGEGLGGFTDFDSMVDISCYMADDVH